LLSMMSKNRNISLLLETHVKLNRITYHDKVRILYWCLFLFNLIVMLWFRSNSVIVNYASSIKSLIKPIIIKVIANINFNITENNECLRLSSYKSWFEVKSNITPSGTIQSPFYPWRQYYRLIFSWSTFHFQWLYCIIL